jgi:hypothetical protein
MKGDKIPATLRIETDLYEQIRTIAEKEQRTINEQLLYFIRLGMSVHKSKLK